MPISFRAGRYVKQPGGFSAFRPAPLPPSPPLRIDDALQDRIGEADRALDRLEGCVCGLAQVLGRIQLFGLAEAVSSCRLEGSRASLDEVVSFEPRAAGTRKTRAVLAIRNYERAVELARQRVVREPITIELLRDAHATLLSGLRGARGRPGELRRVQNWIGPAGSTLDDALFVPPPPTELSETLAQLEQFVRETDRLPLLVRAALAHAQFETIHPFLDGNGRLGRILVTLILARSERLSSPVLYLSRFFERNRDAYERGLQSVRDAGDWEGWVRFFLDGVVETAGSAAETMRAVVRLHERHQRIVVEKLGRVVGNGLRVLDELIRRPTLTVKDVQSLTEVSFAAANGLVSKLRDAGIVKERTGYRRNRRFRYADYVALFAPASR